jgi:predicted 2-oxoglutarate/Fe(II)-dependent dioxygenase YbiX
MPEYRDSVDFKFQKTDIEHDTRKDSLQLQAFWQELYDAKKAAVEDYSKLYNIMELKYWEAFNFIKYGPGQHFQEHHDHGYSYNCTLSLVAYVNDDYEGGELYFRLQDLKVKPEAGDLFIFPSNFMYPHQAMPVTSGTKYSIVTMLDYNKKFHTPEMYVDDTK